MHSPQSVLLFVSGYPLSFCFLLRLHVLTCLVTTHLRSKFRVYIHIMYIYIYIEDKWYGIYELLTRGVIKRRNKSECSIREERDVYLGWKGWNVLYHYICSDYNNLVVRLLIGIVIWYSFCLSDYLRPYTLLLKNIYIYIWLKKIREKEANVSSNRFKKKKKSVITMFRI